MLCILYIHSIEMMLSSNSDVLLIKSAYPDVVDLLKELSLCHKLGFSNLYIFSTKYRRPQIFSTMKSSTSNNLSLKYQVKKIQGGENPSLWQRIIFLYDSQQTNSKILQMHRRKKEVSFLSIGTNDYRILPFHTS